MSRPLRIEYRDALIDPLTDNAHLFFQLDYVFNFTLPKAYWWTKALIKV